MAFDPEVLGRVDGPTDQALGMWIGIDLADKTGVIALGNVGEEAMVVIVGLNARMCAEMSGLLMEAAERLDPDWLEKM